MKSNKRELRKISCNRTERNKFSVLLYDWHFWEAKLAIVLDFCEHTLASLLKQQIFQTKKMRKKVVILILFFFQKI